MNFMTYLKLSWGNLRFRLIENPVGFFPFLWAAIGLLAVIENIANVTIINSRSLEILPDFMKVWLELTWICGGVFAIASVLPRSNIVVDWTFQRLTWVASGLGWASYFFLVLFYNPHAAITWSSMLVLTTVSALRIYKINVTERQITKVIASTNDE